MGVSSVEIIARTARFTGTFFSTGAYESDFKTEYHLLQAGHLTLHLTPHLTPHAAIDTG